MQFKFFLRKSELVVLAYSVVIILLCCSIVRGQPEHQLKNSIDSLLQWKNNDGPGLLVAVVQDGNVLYSKSVGMANIKAKMPNDSSTTFWIASVTKQFTAAAIYKLAAEKEIVLTNSIQTYLTDLPPLFKNVTIDQLIHHTSGIRDGFVLTALAKNPPSAYTNGSVVRYLQQSTDSNFPPGTKFEYNNSGYVLLAMIIEKITGESYPVYMEENIFRPLGMNGTYVSPGFPSNKNQAEGYKEAANTFQEYHFEGNTYGSTGVITTLSDLERWSIFLQHPNSVPALTAIVEPLLTPGKLKNGESISYAGGLEKFQYHGHTMYEHFGSDEGFKADILYFPETKLSLIGLTNNDSYYGLLALLCKVSDVVHNVSEEKKIAINESEEKMSESFYYNSSEPRFIKIQNFSNYSKISNTPSGNGAPYEIDGDTLRSLDPVPTKYLKKSGSIEVLDSYYHNESKLKEIKPIVRNNDLANFAGEYYSDELRTSYKVIAGKDGLQFEFVPGVTFELYRLTDTDFIFDYLGPNYLQFSKDVVLFSREGCRKLVLKKKNEKVIEKKTTP
jgi:CubicO group peptidase (beta-lactamase class C family)